MNIEKLKKITKKRLTAIVVPVVVILVVMVSYGTRGSASNVATFSTQRGEFIIDINTRGELDAASSVLVSVPRQVRGGIRIVDLVEDGTMVKKGDFLVQFDTSEAQEDVTNRENELDNAKGELTSTQARIESNMKQLESNYQTQVYSYEQAKLRFERMKYEAEARRREEELNLKKAELALEQAKEKIETQKIIDKADLAKAEVRMKQAQLRYDEDMAEFNQLTIRSPQSGLAVLQEIRNWSTNTSAKVKIGDTPYRGMALVKIPDLSKMLVKTQVNEVDISLVDLGQKVVITLDAVQGPTFYGAITNIATLAHKEEDSENKVFDIEVTIEGTDERLKPGMTAACTVVTSTIPDVLYIPIESVYERADTTVVYVKDGGFKQRIVKVGRKNSDYIVIEDGLKAGEEVALRDPTLDLKKEEGTEETTQSGPEI